MIGRPDLADLLRISNPGVGPGILRKMRSLWIAPWLGCLTGAVACQDNQLPNAQKPDPKPPTLAVYPIPHLGKKELDPILPWLRAFAGSRGAVEYKAKSGLLVLKADRSGHKRATDLLAWAAAYMAPQIEVTVSVLHGDAARLKSLAESTSRILESREAVTLLLRKAKKHGGIQLKNFQAQQLQGSAPVVLGKEVGIGNKGQRGPLVVGATRLRDEKFLAKTWSPEAPCTEMQCGQTLVVDDVRHGRLILVRYDKVIAKRRPAQIVPVAPVLLKPVKPRPESPKDSDGKKRSSRVP